MSRKRRRRRGSRARRWLLAAAGIAATGLAIHLWLLHRRIDGFLADRSMAPLQVFSDAFRLRAGLSPEGAHLEDRLLRLGYRPDADGRLDPGEFRIARDRFDVGLRPFRYPAGELPAAAVRLELEDGMVRRVVRLSDGRPLPGALVEPELIGSYSGGVLGERREVRLDEIPPHVPAAVLAIEDARFAMHPGIDPIGLVRAAWVNLRGGRILQGGSTITQQLAKNLFLTPERGFVRKANEAVLALMLEARLSKDEILELYLNNVYLGRSGTVGIYGVAAASRAFFGKRPDRLTVGEAATIAGIIHAPNAYSPIRHPKEATTRRDQVLALMAENGWIDGKELAAARARPVEIRPGLSVPFEAPFFVDEVLRRVRRMGYDPETVRGLSVYTGVDVEAQRAAERILAAKLADLEKRTPRLRRAKEPLQGAVALLEAETGFVRAMVGGRDFSRSQFNRVTRSRRQPGSAFKPFVYLSAMDHPGEPFTPSTLLPDEPLRLRVAGRRWEPTNYDGRFLGPVTIRAAIEGSRNVPTVELARRVGLDRIASLAALAGLRSEPVVPAMALGAAEVSLLDLTAAYTVFPNLGEVVRPALIRGVMTHDGQVLYEDRLRRTRIATAPAAYVTSHLLEGVIESGTGAGVRRLGVNGPVAGKTGTTNDEKDAWFVGYSPDWVAGVWIGFDDGTPVGMTGSAAALPVWAGLMREVLPMTAARPFRVPAGVVFRDVDRRSGLLAAWSCPDSVREAFIVGTEPFETCDGRRVEAPRWVGRDEPEPFEEIAPEPDPREKSRGGGDPWRDLGATIRGWFGGR